MEGSRGMKERSMGGNDGKGGVENGRGRKRGALVVRACIGDGAEGQLPPPTSNK